MNPNALLLETSALLMSSHSLGFPAPHLLICPFHVSLSLVLAFHLFANSFPLSSRVIPAHPWRLPGPPSLVTCSILEMQSLTPFSELSVFPSIVPVTQNYNYLHACLSLEPEFQEGSHRILSSVAVPAHSTAQHSCSLPPSMCTGELLSALLQPRCPHRPDSAAVQPRGSCEAVQEDLLRVTLCSS